MIGERQARFLGLLLCGFCILVAGKKDSQLDKFRLVLTNVSSANADEETAKFLNYGCEALIVITNEAQDKSNTGNSGGGIGGATTVVPPKPGVTGLDANVYATKKTIAQGLLDVALLTANASQLKYLLQAGKEHEFYYVMMVLIILSILLQVSLGVVILLKGRRDINDEAQQEQANWLNNIAVWLVFVSTVVHVFLSVFTIEPKEQPPFPEAFDFQEPNMNDTLSSSTFDYDES